jgi:hypothetical protein
MRASLALMVRCRTFDRGNLPLARLVHGSSMSNPVESDRSELDTMALASGWRALLPYFLSGGGLEANASATAATPPSPDWAQRFIVVFDGPGRPLVVRCRLFDGLPFIRLAHRSSSEPDTAASISGWSRALFPQFVSGGVLKASASATTADWTEGFISVGLPPVVAHGLNDGGVTDHGTSLGSASHIAHAPCASEFLIVHTVQTHMPC